jgi:O-antigen ligase
MDAEKMEKEESLSIAHRLLWTGVLLLVFLLPLVFSTSVYRGFETVKSSLLRVSVVLLFLGWCITKYRGSSFSLFSSTPITRAVVLFVFASFVSSLLSIEPTLSVFGIYDRQCGFIGILAASFFCLLLAGGLQARGWERGAVLKAMVFSGTIVALYSVLQYFNLDPIPWSKAFGNRPSSTVGHPDFLGEVLVMTIPLTLSLCYFAGKWELKAAWILFLLIQMGGLFVSQTRGAWIAAAVSIPMFFLLEPFLHRKDARAFRKKALISLLALSLLLGIGVSGLLLKPEFRHRALSILNIKEQTRIYLWRDSFKVIKEHPIFGSGPETFRLSFMPHKGIELARMEKNVNYDNPHNNYLYLWATTGTVGLIAYFYMLWCCFREGMGRLRKDRDDTSPTFYLGMVTALVAYCVSMLTGFDTICTLLYLYTLIALFGASESRVAPETRSTGTSLKRKGLIIVPIILLSLTVYDAARTLLADHLALKGLSAAGKNPPGLFEARALLERSCKALPRESFYRIQLALVHLRMGQYGKGKEEALREAIHWGSSSLNHGWAPENSFNIISTAYLNLRDCRSAEEACRQALAIDPHNYPLLANLAVSLSCQGKRKEALDAVEKVLSIDPTNQLAIKLRKSLSGK